MSFLVLGFPTKGETPSSSQEYRERVKRLNLRFEGFFKHKKDRRNWEKKRKAGIPQLKKKRSNYKNSRETARKNFVRKPPKNMEPLRLRWEKRQEELEELRGRKRVDFARQQDKIKNIESTARKIPPMEELGLSQ